MKNYLAAAVVGAGALILWANLKHTQMRKLDKELVINVLRELEKEINKVLIEIAARANKIKENSLEIPSEQKLKEIICNDFQFENKIKAAETRAYQKFGISEMELQMVMEKELKDDKDVSDITEKMKNGIEDAYKGFVIGETSYIPFGLTSEPALGIIKEVYDCELYIAYLKKSQLAERRGNKDWDIDEDENEDWDINQNVEESNICCKLGVLRAFGYHLNHYDVNNCIRQIIRNFTKIDEEWKHGLVRAENKYNRGISDITQDRMSPQIVEYLKGKYNKYYFDNFGERY